MEISNKANLPTKFGDFFVQSFREVRDSSVLEHLVVFTQILGENPLIRIHSECLTGDVFGSCKCDCGDELAIAMREIAKDKSGGMLIYLRQEGRGIGLFNKINAYALQDSGLDTVEANEALGFKSDNRDYAVLGEIFAHFHIKKLRLLTNNPRKVESIARYAEVSRVSIIAAPNKHNANYLKVKKQKLGHLL